MKFQAMQWDGSDRSAVEIAKWLNDPIPDDEEKLMLYDVETGEMEVFDGSEYVTVQHGDWLVYDESRGHPMVHVLADREYTDPELLDPEPEPEISEEPSWKKMLIGTADPREDEYIFDKDMMEKIYRRKTPTHLPGPMKIGKFPKRSAGKFGKFR